MKSYASVGLFARGAYGYNASARSGPGIGYGSGKGGLPSLGLGGLNYGGSLAGSTAPVRENQVVSPSDMIAIGDAFFDENPHWEDGCFWSPYLGYPASTT